MFPKPTQIWSLGHILYATHSIRPYTPLGQQIQWSQLRPWGNLIQSSRWECGGTNVTGMACPQRRQFRCRDGCRHCRVFLFWSPGALYSHDVAFHQGWISSLHSTPPPPTPDAGLQPCVAERGKFFTSWRSSVGIPGSGPPHHTCPPPAARLSTGCPGHSRRTGQTVACAKGHCHELQLQREEKEAKKKW